MENFYDNTVDREELFGAVFYSDIKLLKQLLEDVAYPNVTNDRGETPLVVASRLGFFSGVKLLLEAKADPNATDSYGNTPLDCAASNGHTQIIKLLKEAAASFNLAKESKIEEVTIEEPGEVFEDLEAQVQEVAGAIVPDATLE